MPPDAPQTATFTLFYLAKEKKILKTAVYFIHTVIHKKNIANYFAYYAKSINGVECLRNTLFDDRCKIVEKNKFPIPTCEVVEKFFPACFATDTDTRENIFLTVSLFKE